MSKEINIDREEVRKKGKKAFSDFKDFIAKGNVMDMAVGVIMGGAFGKIVTSLVDNILMPLLGVVIGGIDFTDLSLKVKDATVAYGVFIQNVIDFLIIAFCIFIMVKGIEKLNRKKVEEAEEEPPKKDENIVLLEEIRDLLKEKQKV